MHIETGVKLLVPLVLIIGGVDCYPRGTSDGNKTTSFDFFVFAQQWPVAVCVQGEAQHHTCNIPSDVKGWGVHGLWPSKNAVKEFVDCDKEKKFDIHEVEKLLPEMERSWPNLYNDTEKSSFWQHEWQKHGTCALSNSQTSNEYKYFKKGLELHTTYSLSKILESKGIIPSQTASLKYADIIGALQTMLTVKPVLGCIKDSETKKFMISQIEICLNNDFKLIDCHSANDSCPKDAPLYYPIIRKLKDTDGNVLSLRSYRRP